MVLGNNSQGETTTILHLRGEQQFTFLVSVIPLNVEVFHGGPGYF